MASKKAPKNDLNAPLRSLSDRLRSLQREAGQVLDTLRGDARRGRAAAPEEAEAGPRSVGGGGLEAQLDRVASGLMARWDIPTRADFDDIRQRLEQIEAAFAARNQPAVTAKTAKKNARTTKSRRSKGSTTSVR